MSTNIKVSLAHGEQKQTDNNVQYTQRVNNNEYIAYHEEDGTVWLNLGQILKDQPTQEGCPTHGCCIPAGSC